MKKTIILIAAVLIGVSSFSQNNLFESFKQFDGKEFKKFNVVDYQGFSITAFDHGEAKPIISTVKNKYGKPIGVEVTKQKYSSWDVNGQFRKEKNKLDHYSQPAYVREFGKRSYHHAFIMVEDMLFHLSSTSEDMKTYTIDRIWIPTTEVDKKVEVKKEEVKKEEPKKKKKKGRFGSFMSKLKEKAEATLAVANNLPTLPERLRQYKSMDDLKKIVDTYIAEMRKKQASNPITAQDRKEIQGMKDQFKKEDDAIIKANNDYWRSKEGQRILNNGKRNSSSSSSSNKSSSSKTVKVKLHAGRGANFYYVSWNGGKKTIAEANTEYVNIPAGTKVYLSKTSGGKKSYLGQVPSGKSTHTFELR